MFDGNICESPDFQIATFKTLSLINITANGSSQTFYVIQVQLLYDPICFNFIFLQSE